MSEKLTRAEVEKHLETARQYAKANALGSLIDSNHLIALCNMALGFLAMQPRPISEAPKDTALLVIEKGSGFPWEIAHFNTYRKAWVRNLDGVPISIPTHFIPLTSLQEPSQ